MINLFCRILFLVFSVFILIKTSFYGFYEFNALKNKSGGIAIIVFSFMVMILTNVVVFIK